MVMVEEMTIIYKTLIILMMENKEMEILIIA
jgi:hypothetical protein